jgi:hypothetical protein
MGEKQKRPFQLSFNASLRVDFQGSRVTSDGGLVLVRELDERLGFDELAAECLTDTRAEANGGILVRSRTAKRKFQLNQFAVSAPANRRHDPKLPLILNGRVPWLTLALAYFSVDGGIL